MGDEEEIVATFVNSVTHLTGSNKFGQQLRKRITLLKHKAWLLSLVLWSLIIGFWILRK